MSGEEVTGSLGGWRDAGRGEGERLCWVECA